jgi:hypothetical protein
MTDTTNTLKTFDCTTCFAVVSLPGNPTVADVRRVTRYVRHAVTVQGIPCVPGKRHRWIAR